tara:strand:+ start:2499 stop:4901 length:2403 start_codon:yes stop_codon:yes gene_type:complete
MKSAIRKFPRQKLSFKQKSKKWRKSHLDWADDQGKLFNETVRKRMGDKKINIDLYNGIVHQEDMKLTMNPNGLDEFYVPSSIQHYPIAAPRIDVLVGEESERRFDWKVRVINPTAISDMESDKKEMVAKKIEELVTMEYSEEEMEKELEKYSNYINFEYQDIREKRANLLLNHYVKELRVQHSFTEGIRDACLVGEEGYLCDIKHGNPTFEKLNPLKTYVIQHGYSNKYEDASVIVLDDYWSPGKFIDEYNDQLTSKDIDYILSSGVSSGNSGSSRELDGDMFLENVNDRDGIQLARSLANDLDFNMGAMDNMANNFNSKSDYFDSQGNIRVLRIFWASYKKIYVVKSISPETGDETIKYRDENYILDEVAGETMEVRWVKQWWQGVKAGKKVYTDMGPRKIQYNKHNNPGYNTPGIVGQIFNINDQKVVSIMDRCKVFNYIFDGAFHRLMDAYSKYFGPLLEIDKAKMPEGWGITKTLYFAKKAGVLVIDSFKEGKKGMATGKLAGAIGNTSGKIYNPEIANYIQQNINMMEYAKSMMDEVIGVPKQRLGNVEKRETVGGVDTAIRQGNYVTAMLYKNHDELKRRALSLLLETAKIALKGNKLKLAFVGDDYTNQLMEIDGDEICEEDYGLEVTNEGDNIKLEQNLEKLAHAALQNQMLSFSTIMKVFTSPSLVEIQRMIEKDERDTQSRQAEAGERDSKIAKEQMMKAEALEQQKIELEKYAIDEKSRIEELKLLMTTEGDEIPDEENNDDEKLNLDRQKHLDNLQVSMKKLDNDMKKHDDKMVLDTKKLNKPTTTTK